MVKTIFTFIFFLLIGLIGGSLVSRVVRATDQNVYTPTGALVHE